MGYVEGAREFLSGGEVGNYGKASPYAGTECSTCGKNRGFAGTCSGPDCPYVYPTCKGCGSSQGTTRIPLSEFKEGTPAPGCSSWGCNNSKTEWAVYGNPDKEPYSAPQAAPEKKAAKKAPAKKAPAKKAPAKKAAAKTTKDKK